MPATARIDLQHQTLPVFAQRVDRQQTLNGSDRLRATAFQLTQLGVTLERAGADGLESAPLLPQPVLERLLLNAKPGQKLALGEAGSALYACGIAGCTQFLQLDGVHSD